MGLSIFWKIYGTSKNLASNEGNCGFKEMLHGGSHLLTTSVIWGLGEKCLLLITGCDKK